jgi:hypothetical protein
MVQEAERRRGITKGRKEVLSELREGGYFFEEL